MQRINATVQGAAMAPPPFMPDGSCGEHSPRRELDVVAVVLVRRRRVALFKRSHLVNHDRGRWHCVTGYVDQGIHDPRAQAILELEEETGLNVRHLTRLVTGPTLVIPGGAWTWRVHTFTAQTKRRRLELNWESDSYQWVRLSDVQRFGNRVEWLDVVLDASEAPVDRRVHRLDLCHRIRPGPGPRAALASLPGRPQETEVRGGVGELHPGSGLVSCVMAGRRGQHVTTKGKES